MSKYILKIGMVGSDRYEDKRKIKNTIFSIKKSLTNFEICTRGKLEGAEKFIKNYCVEFDCPFSEFLPAHMSKSLYSPLSTNYYDKPYSPRNYFIRDNIFCKYIDKLMIFSFKKNLDEFNDLIKKMNKMEKNIVIID